MRKLRYVQAIVGTAAAAMLAAASTAAAAPNGPSGQLDIVNDASVRVAEVPSYSYGSEVHLVGQVDGKLANGAETYLAVVCTDASNPGDIVYLGYSWALDHSFPLVLPDGEVEVAADCVGKLVYRVKKGKNIDYQVLDREPFSVHPVA